MSDGFKLVDDKNRGNFIEELKKIDWIYWLNRPYSVFMATIFWEGLREKYFKRSGFEGLAPNNNLYQFPDIYYDKKFLEKGIVFFDNYFKNHKVSDLSDLLAVVHQKNITELKKVISDKKKTIPQKVAIMSDLVKDYLPFLWIIVPLEEYFNKKVALEVPKFIDGDYSKIIGDVSIPRKKNAYILMQDKIKSGVSIKEIVDKYGWIKSRDGFTDFYTEKEIEEIKNGLKEGEIHNVVFPDGLLNLSEELKELTFLRTDRTDKFYEFFSVARPLMIEIAKHIGIEFKELANYDANSIILDDPKKYNKDFSYGLINDQYILSNDLLISDFKKHESDEIKGRVAFKGVVTGIAKIVTHSNDLNKVNKGDILVTQMTLPSFISAMQKAVAFVTDEGSITCHAAIIAREMKKPCIIGTKNATKVIKDGDLIEVNANSGVVKILKKA
ncbi:MAG: PEP-utilizing enzyme [bacterium]